MKIPRFLPRGLAVLVLLSLAAGSARAVIIANFSSVEGKYAANGTFDISFAASDWTNGFAEIQRYGTSGPEIDPNYFGYGVPGFYIYQFFLNSSQLMRTRVGFGSSPSNFFTTATIVGETMPIQYMDIHWKWDGSSGTASGAWGWAYDAGLTVPDGEHVKYTLIFGLAGIFLANHFRARLWRC